MRSKVVITRSKIMGPLKTLTGLLLVLAAALITAGLFSHSTFRIFVPLGFVVVLIVLAARFGVMVGVLGSVLAALVFAQRLYAPSSSLHVEQLAARENLAWMILAAVSLSYLLFPPHPRSR
ncbi:MAG: hypothetical protein ABSD88_14055 [Candidatus Korobacteraceae bacterium]